MNDAVRGETVADYKRLLQIVCDNRPSGTRGRLAVALGTNRSFVSQLVNPAYAMPIPAQHLETIFEICHFSPADRAAFLAVYDNAHPGRRETGEVAYGNSGHQPHRARFGECAAEPGGRRLDRGIWPPRRAPRRRC